MRDHVPYLSNDFFRTIPPEKVAAAGLDLPRVTYEPGARIFEEGAAEDCCYLVESGSVRISKAGTTGQETLGYVGPGSFFGEIALYDASPRTARATAATAVTAAVLRGEDFARLQAAAPLEVATTIAHAALERLGRMNAHLVQQLESTDAFREIGAGLSVIAHDMRSPLATIRGAAELMKELLQREPLDAAQLDRFVDMILRTASRGLESADELLAVLRGEREHASGSVEVGELLTDVTLQVRGLVTHPGITFVSEAETGGFVTCERNELTRALLNLVRNAVEALPAAGGRVTLRARATEEHAVFTVEDDGCGIPAELQGRIFERTFTHGKKGGTGLGLHQVRRIVERHGGQIALRSQPGAGTTFTIVLPAADAARDLPVSAAGERHTGGSI